MGSGETQTREPAAVALAARAGDVAVPAALALLVAVNPLAGALTAPAAVVLAIAWHRTDIPLLHLRAAAGVAAAAAVALAITVTVATWPGVALLAAAAAAVVTVVARSAAWRPVVAVTLTVLAAGALAGLPAAAGLGLLVSAILVLAWIAPAWALAAAVLLFAFEGTVKVLVGLDPSPLPASERAVGALALDVALFGAIAAVLVDDRLATPRRVWHAASRAERIAIGLLGGWLVLSVAQIVQGGDLERGLQGFRVFQLYVLAALAALAVFAAPRIRGRALEVALGIGLAVSAYAAFRVAVGPADAEYAFASSVETVVGYGGAFRAIGSFSSAVGLSSFLAPLATFAAVAGYLVPRVRVLAWIVAALAFVGILGSYGRASFAGMLLGLLAALALVVAAADVPLRRKLAGAGLVLGFLVASYAGVQLASQASDQLRDRAQGLLNPLDDESLQLRFDNWEETLRRVRREPLGQGVGAVGAASADVRRQVITTDNSYLKVLVEQGVAGASIFVAGLLAAVVLLARRLRHLRGEPRGLGVAALAGFVTFLGIAVLGEYVEQPGKVLAWGLLGIAAAQALARCEDADATESEETA